MLPPLLSIYGRKDNAKSKEIQIFTNDQFGEVRTLNKDGEPWFVGKDVAQALGYGEGKSLANAVANHVDDDDKGVTEMMTPGGKQNMVVINESGLYSLVLSSKLPAAKAFKRWVTSEVLPAIRKHGEYTAPKVSQKRLGEVNSAARIIRQTLKEAGMAPQFVAVAMKSLYVPVGVEIPLEGVTLNKQMFDATAIAKQLGVLSRSGKPHAHAISAILAQVDVLPEEKELAPFQSAVSGHAGTNVQYTKSVVAKVSLWLERHDYPESFEYRGKKYTLRYSAAA